MIRLRNVAYENASAGFAAVLAATTYNFALFVNNTGKTLKIRKASFVVAGKGAGGTSFTANILKNGTTVLSTIPVCTTGTMGADYTVKFDTNKEFAATAPTGVSALPVLSTTEATITVKPGDVVELSTTNVGVYTGTGPKLVATVHMEYVTP
jgi:hypothetical protein